jgi:tRNA dimethylallyltransferase
VGGTGLYFKTLVDGLSDVPEIDSEIRTKIRGQLTEEGSEILHQRLSEIDPIMASRLAPKDGQRTARALEVIISSGQSLAHWQEQPPEGGLAQEDNIEIQRNIMTLGRAVLYDRCNRRFMMMMQEDDGSFGALEEVRHLMTLGYRDNIGVMKSLGVAHLSAYLRGEITQAEAVTLAQTATRQYAKRQMTWFRNQCSDWNRVFS